MHVTGCQYVAHDHNGRSVRWELGEVGKGQSGNMDEGESRLLTITIIKPI